MLRLRNINSFYGNIQALKNVNIEISRGEIITLIGANGGGQNNNFNDDLGFSSIAFRRNHFYG